MLVTHRRQSDQLFAVVLTGSNNFALTRFWSFYRRETLVLSCRGECDRSPVPDGPELAVLHATAVCQLPHCSVLV